MENNVIPSGPRKQGPFAMSKRIMCRRWRNALNPIMCRLQEVIEEVNRRYDRSEREFFESYGDLDFLTNMAMVLDCLQSGEVPEEKLAELFKCLGPDDVEDEA